MNFEVMSKKQIKWASEHDWFLGEGNGEVFVNEVMLVAGIWIEEVLSFKNFEDLKAWAGY